MLAYGQVYTKVLNKAIKDALRKANTHNVLELYQRDTRFLAQETISPREDQPAGRFHGCHDGGATQETTEQPGVDRLGDDKIHGRLLGHRGIVLGLVKDVASE
ncbi:hypothetical protein JHK87_004634 [Glycine soja]|nr:hypothetical protein JHK87_004634 [Glycine soja]KAG5080742.1 hypothetical protein JHK86_004807 [Glycine max]